MPKMKGVHSVLWQEEDDYGEEHQRETEEDQLPGGSRDSIAQFPINWRYSPIPKSKDIDERVNQNANRICQCQNVDCYCTSCDFDFDSDEIRPVRRAVKSKGTNASVLRNAAILLKDDAKRNQKILDLLSNSTNYFDYENYLYELRERRQKEELVELEKKHLNGQLSYEEAILAKKRVLEANALKRRKYSEEKAALDEELETFRSEELAKIKKAVQNVYDQRGKVKDVYDKTIKIRQKVAKTLSEQLKNELKKSLDERKIEIDKKIAAIRELKILQQIKKEELNDKEEKMSKLLGASIEELKARLILVKKRLRDELTKKKEKILRTKCRRDTLKIAAENFIREVNDCKEKMKIERVIGEKNELKMTRTKEIIENQQLNELRNKLEKARMNRQMFQNQIKKLNA